MVPSAKVGTHISTKFCAGMASRHQATIEVASLILAIQCDARSQLYGTPVPRPRTRARQFVWQNPLAFSRSLSPIRIQPPHAMDALVTCNIGLAGAYDSISSQHCLLACGSFPLMHLHLADDEMMTQSFRNTYRGLSNLMDFCPEKDVTNARLGYQINKY